MYSNDFLKIRLSWCYGKDQINDLDKIHMVVTGQLDERNLGKYYNLFCHGDISNSVIKTKIIRSVP